MFFIGTKSRHILGGIRVLPVELERNVAYPADPG